MERPKLTEILLSRTPFAQGIPDSETLLIGPGEWDEEIRAAYNAGHTLIEFDASEIPVRAYCKRPGRMQEIEDRARQEELNELAGVSHE